MKKYCFLLALEILLVLLLTLSSVSASFTISNYSIEKNYAAGDKLKGWFNISLQNQTSELISSNFNGSIDLINFLEENNVDYECIPSDCEKDYELLNADTTRTISINSGQSKLIGFKLQGKVIGINTLKFDLDSTAKSSCVVPLKLDVLDNEEENWQYTNVSNEFCATLRGLCFSNSVEEIELDQGLRCEKINLIERKAYKIGAWIRKSGSANLKAYLYSIEDLSKSDSCDLPDASESSGEIGCVINKTITSTSGEYYICVNADRDSSYAVQFEQAGEKCGFYDIDIFSSTEEYNSDYNVFAKPAEYVEVEKFTFDNSLFHSEQETLEEYIWNYINSRYDGNCQEGCAIPMKITVGATQDIMLSDILLDYNTDIKSHKTTNIIYNLNEISTKLNSDFAVLDLKYSNITIFGGSQELKLFLGENLILTENITIAKLIVSVNPTFAYAAIPTTFTANISNLGNKSIRSYVWDFGDEEEKTTNANFVTHIYSGTGTYILKLSVEDEEGLIYSKEFTISVGNPKEIVNSTIKEYNERIRNITNQLSLAPSWIKPLIEKQINLSTIEKELAELEKKYQAASSDDSYIEIMSALQELKVPTSLKVIDEKMDFLPNPENINPSYLAEFTGEKISEGIEQYKDIIVSWINENMNIEIESKTYVLYYEEIVPVVSVFTLKIKPKKDFLKETYLIIDKNYDEIKFKEDYKEKAVKDVTIITFSELKQDEEKTIEFALTEKIELIELPLFISTAVSQLPSAKIGPCNYNKKCEKDLEETAKNCPSDCTNWNKIIKYFLILLVVAFVVYIALQEWYKRYYEKHLFKNKNELFNLIYFIYNALNKKLDKEEIIKKLKNYGWSGEQISYAFKKTLGKRTGMLEIPIFKLFEKIRIKKEIEKRKAIGQLYPSRLY